MNGSIKQWLHRRLSTALTVQRKSQSHLEESLDPIPLATQLQERKLCLDVSFSSGSSCSNLLAIDTGNQKGAGKEHSKGSFHTPLEGWQNIFPSQEDMITFNCKLFSVSYSSCLAANKAEARISSSDLLVVAYFHGHRLVSWVWLRLTAGDGNLWVIVTRNRPPPHMRRQNNFGIAMSPDPFPA